MAKVLRIFVIFAFFFYLQLTACSLRLYALDKIVAVVNNEIITQKELDDFLNFMRIQLSRELKGAALDKKIEESKRELLDKLIEDKLILQEANKEKVTLEESRVKARISEIKKRYGSEQEFQFDIARQGMVQADIEKKIREQFLMYNIIEMKVRSKIRVSPEEVTSFYNENKKEMVTPEIRELEVITLENMDQASSFAYNLKRGERVEDLATRYPVTINRISYSEKGELRKEIESAAEKLGLDEASSPVEIDDKAYVLRLFNIIPPKHLSLSEAQERVHDFIFNSKMQQELVKWLDELKRKSYIKITQG